MDHYGRVWIISAHVSPSVIVELLDLAHVQAPVAGLIDELNCRDDVGLGGIAVGEGFDSEDGLVNIITSLPVYGAFSATVVEAVLGTGC